MLDGSLATVYTKLWYLSDDATLPVSALYELAGMMPNGERAYFATLQEFGFDDWAAFEDAKSVSLEVHRMRGTVER